MAQEKETWELDFIESALNHYWNDANTNLQRKDLGDLEKKNYQSQLDKSKDLMQQIDRNQFYLQSKVKELEERNKVLEDALRTIYNIENAAFNLSGFDVTRLKKEIEEALSNNLINY